MRSFDSQDRASAFYLRIGARERGSVIQGARRRNQLYALFVCGSLLLNIRVPIVIPPVITARLKRMRISTNSVSRLTSAGVARNSGCLRLQKVFPFRAA